jgi:hypothetical protein
MADWMSGTDGLNYYNPDTPPDMPDASMPMGAAPMEAPGEFTMAPGEAGKWMLNGGVTGMGGQDVLSQLRQWYGPQANLSEPPMGVQPDAPMPAMSVPAPTNQAPPPPAQMAQGARMSPFGRGGQRGPSMGGMRPAMNLGALGQLR